MLTLFGGEPLLNLPVAYYLAERLWQASQARGVQMHAERDHQRAAAHAGGGRPAGAVRPERGEDHARRRSRHAQPHAAAARRPGHLRQDHPERPRAWRASAAFRSAATSTRARSTATRRFSTSCSEQEFADKIARVAFKPVIREPKPQQPKGMIPLTVVGAGNKPLNGTCMTSAGSGTSSASICDTCNFLDEKMSYPPRRDQEARVLDGGRRPHGAVRDSPRARPHHRSGRGDVCVPRIHR